MVPSRWTLQLSRLSKTGRVPIVFPKPALPGIYYVSVKFLDNFTVVVFI